MLIAYKASADLAGKGSLFLITIVAARRLSPQAFGIFSLGSAFGWLIAVATDCGIQLHLARAVSRAPADAARLLAAWLRIRLWTAGLAMIVVAAGLMAWRWPVGYALPIAIFALMYACSSLIEFLYYFYRGMSRSDIESSLTLWQRGGTLIFGLAALAWRPDVTVLALAMLAPIVAALAVSLRISLRLAPVGAADRVPDDDCAGVFRRDVWPIGAGIVLSALYFRIDVFLVQLWSGTTAVALYNSVFRLVEALRLLPAAVLAVVLPTLCRAHDLRPVVRTSAWLGRRRRDLDGRALGRCRLVDPLPLRRPVRSGGAGVSRAASGVSVDVDQLRADASTNRLGWAADLCRGVPDRARRERGDERAPDPGVVDRRRGMVNARHRSVSDAGVRGDALDPPGSARGAPAR